MPTLSALGWTLSLLTPAIAWADSPSRVQIGFMTGAHIFATDSELGVADDEGAVPTLKTGMLLGARVGYALSPHLTLEGEIDGIPTSDSAHDDSAFVVGWRAHGLVPFQKIGVVTPFGLIGVGGLSIFADGGGLSRPESDTDTAFHWGGGLMVDVSRTLAVRIDVRDIIGPSTGDQGFSTDFEFQAGISYRLGAESHTPTAEPVVTTETPRLTLEALIEATSQPTTISPPKVALEQPGSTPAAAPSPAADSTATVLPEDSDNDGIPDDSDQCRKDAETKNGIDDSDGCPDIDVNVDLDGDGLAGAHDKCPDQAGSASEDGCPASDRDSDGVADLADKCPEEPEARNGFLDGDGCKDELPSDLKAFTGTLSKVAFRKKEPTVLRTDAKAYLDDAVRVLQKYPETKMEIACHTSDEGDHDQNVELSRRRAELIKEYLVSVGLKAERIVPIGYGPDKPIADNRTAKGREDNQRVEFKLIVE